MEKQNFARSDDWAKWEPRAYLDTYFKKLGPDSLITIDFIEKNINRRKKTFDNILDFGCGPSALIALAVEPKCNSITCVDFLKENILELNKFVDNKTDSFDWSEATKTILKMNGVGTNKAAVEKRMKNTRQKIILGICDAKQESPLLRDKSELFDVTMSIFCADSATTNHEEWKDFMKNIFSTVKDRGEVVIAALRNCQRYYFNGHFFPSANVDEGKIKYVLEEAEFKVNCMEVHQTPTCSVSGFDSIVLAHASR